MLTWSDKEYSRVFIGATLLAGESMLGIESYGFSFLLTLHSYVLAGTIVDTGFVIISIGQEMIKSSLNGCDQYISDLLYNYIMTNSPNPAVYDMYLGGTFIQLGDTKIHNFSP
jgi:hypothetical protein